MITGFSNILLVLQNFLLFYKILSSCVIYNMALWFHTDSNFIPWMKLEQVRQPVNEVWMISVLIHHFLHSASERQAGSPLYDYTRLMPAARHCGNPQCPSHTNFRIISLVPLSFTSLSV